MTGLIYLTSAGKIVLSRSVQNFFVTELLEYQTQEMEF